MSGSSSGDITKTRRYAEYIEGHHGALLDHVSTTKLAIFTISPFADYVPVEIDAAYFGLGYLISSFPSLYDMFGKHMAGLDIESIWNSTFGKIVGEPSIDTAISENMKLVDDEMVRGELADFQVGMRNLNAVTTSSFVVGKAVVEDKRVKLFAKTSLEAKVELLPNMGSEYISHINWEKMTVTVYARAIKDYLMYKNLVDVANTTFASRDSLWPFTVLSFEGKVLGTMQSATSWKKTMDRERSLVSKTLLVLSYTATGAVIGGEIGGGYGAIIGAVIGIIVGIAIMLLE